MKESFSINYTNLRQCWSPLFWPRSSKKCVKAASRKANKSFQFVWKIKEADLRHFPVALKDFLDVKFWGYKVLREAGFSHQSFGSSRNGLCSAGNRGGCSQLSTLSKKDHDEGDEGSLRSAKFIFISSALTIMKFSFKVETYWSLAKVNFISI